MATRPKAVIESRNGEKFSPITIAKNVLIDDGQNLHDILSDRKEDMMTPTIENSSSMFKVGQGDNVDYSSNVVNGAYESMILKGKTMVNYIQEPSSKDVILPYAFEDGQYVTINDTKESGALSVKLKGRTLVNATGEPIVNLVINSATPKYLRQHILKKDTVYTFIYDIEEVTGDASGCWGRFNYTDGSFKNVLDKVYTTGITKVVTSFDGDLQSIYIGWIRNHVAGQSVKFKSVMILEGDWTDKEIPPYFTGMASCKMPILHTTGKNLFDYSSHPITLEKLAYADGQQVYWTGYIGVKTYVPVKENTTYTYSNDINVGIHFGLVFYDDDKSVLSYINNFKTNNSFTSFTTPKGCKFIRFAMETQTIPQWIQLEEATSPTSYESYKSSILSLPEEVVLRSLSNGVRDTFNTRTGVYTQRIGEVFLNGSESWAYNPAATDKTLGLSGFSLSVTATPDRKWYGATLCDKMPVITSLDKVGVYNGQGLNILIKSDSTNANTLKEILAKDPITVQYQLENPIVTKINLSSTLKSWNTTTHIYSEIPENTLYPILSHSNPSYPVILKPSTKYSIVANSYSNSHTNSAINFNLGGATASTTVGNRVTTITTPSTLSNELLTMSGRGNKLNNVMVIEGDVAGDEPYFEGICDSKSPILSNVGKNLFTTRDSNVGTHPNHKLDVLGENHIEITATTNETGWLYTTYEVKGLVPNTTYILSGDVSEGVNNSSGSKGVMLIHDFNTGTSTANVDSSNRAIRYTTPKDVTKVRVLFYSSLNRTPNKIGDTYSFKNIQLEEAQDITTYEPYKSNILSCNGDKIELTADMFEQGTFSTSQTGATYESVKENNNTRIRSKKLMRVKPNTTYRFKFDSSCQMLIGGYDSNQKCLGSELAYTWLNEKVFTTPANGHYISIAIRKGSGSSNITPSEFNSTGLAIWEVDKTIVLRSLPNGVCDTLNVETGEYIKRIGKVVLNGSQTIETWWNTTSTVGVRVNIPTMKNISNMICDRLPVKYYRDINNNTYDTEGIASWDVGNSVYFRILKSKLETEDINGVKKYLAINPVTVQYELEVPIVETVDLSGFPFSYENGHVQLSSGSIEQSLTPKVEYSVVTNRNGQIRSNQKMVERHQKQLDRLQAMVLTNLVNTQYEQTLTNLKYDLKNVREEVK